MIPLLNCTAIVNPSLPEIIWCAITLACGGELIATVLLFAIFLYGMHTAKIPAIPSVSIGLVMIFVFSGASNGLLAFETIQWFALMAIGAALALFLWGFAKK